MWGKFPVPPDAPWFEPLTCSPRSRRSTDARAARDRHPDRAACARPLAREAGRDARPVSGGRVDLGVGTGWQREEYDAAGLDVRPSAGSCSTDTLAACKVLWRDTPAALDTPTLSFRDIYCEPKPCSPAACRCGSRARCTRRNLDALVR